MEMGCRRGSDRVGVSGAYHDPRIAFGPVFFDSGVKRLKSF